MKSVLSSVQAPPDPSARILRVEATSPAIETDPVDVWELPLDRVLAWYQARVAPNIFRSEVYAQTLQQLKAKAHLATPTVIAWDLGDPLPELAAATGVVRLHCTGCKQTYERPVIEVIEQDGFEVEGTGGKLVVLNIELKGNAGLTHVYCPAGCKLEDYERWIA